MPIDPRKVTGENSQLNMTPMIDIVFQLILFFLFSLKFKSLDYRIEAQMPKNGGVDWGPPVDLTPHLRVTLSRVHAEDLDRARTKVKLAGREWVLPLADKATEDERDRVLADIAAQIVALRPVSDGRGEIDTPMPTGGLVPHGDVMSMLDAFLVAELKQVDFQGTAAPLPKRH